ncbi:MAG: hypothetical protein ACOC9B_04980 [Chloroflexota bacterium]
MNLKRIITGASAVAIASVGLALPASANHGPNCDEPREDVVAFLQDNMDEWNVYDRDDDGVACETTHALTKADIDGDGEDDNGEVETPSEIDTGR